MQAVVARPYITARHTPRHKFHRAARCGATQIDMDAAQQSYTTLNNGKRMPLLGLGTSGMSNEEAEQAVKAALEMGYRHIDTAAQYGCEEGVGRGLKSAKVGGEEVFIVSKLWHQDHGEARVGQACRESLARLQLEYVDLYLVHWPLTDSTRSKDGQLDPPFHETWAAMEKLVDEGLVRSIGVSNLSCKKLGQVLEYARIPPAANQVEVHAYHRNQKLLDFCTKHSVHVTSYLPIAKPTKYDDPRLLDDPAVRDVAAQVHKTPAQVLLRWGIQRGTSVIPKTVHENRLQENADVFDWRLDETQQQRLSFLAFQKRLIDGHQFLEKSPYKNTDDLWDGEE